MRVGLSATSASRRSGRRRFPAVASRTRALSMSSLRCLAFARRAGFAWSRSGRGCRATPGRRRLVTIWPVSLTNSLSIRPATRAETVPLAALVEFDVADRADLLRERPIIDRPRLDAGQHHAIGRQLHAIDDSRRARLLRATRPFLRFDSGMKQIGHFSLPLSRTTEGASGRTIRRRIRPPSAGRRCGRVHLS